MTSRRLRLNAFLLGTGHHEAAWRRDDTEPDRTLSAELYTEFALIAERGCFDSVFFGDHLTIGPNNRFDSRDFLEPFTLLAAIAARTTSIGLIGTASTTYHTPFEIARLFASLDHISRGRVGWNVVTSSFVDEARNFGDERPTHESRYNRAGEFLAVARALWESWGEGARVIDKTARLYVDTDLVRPIDHRGEHFTVRGPLNIPRPPQGHPLIVQAGSSEDGREFSSRHADATFTAQPTLDSALAFAADLRERVRRAGRDPGAFAILPGLVPVLGGTDAEAAARLEEYASLLSPESGVEQLSRQLEHDLSVYGLDDLFPDVSVGEDFDGNRTRAELTVRIAREGGLTIRQVIARLAAGSGHLLVAGTPERVADTIEEWFTAGACDGFNVMPLVLPSSLTEFVDQVVPLLQGRGIFRTSYDTTTLRGHFGAPAVMVR